MNSNREQAQFRHSRAFFGLRGLSPNPCNSLTLLIAGGWARTSTPLRKDGMRRSTSVAGYPWDPQDKVTGSRPENGGRR